MSGPAIMMLVLFIVVIWGGLIASIIHLNRHPDESSGALGEAPDSTDEALYGHGN